MLLYKTVKKEASAEQIIERSRFIAYVKPVSTKEEADAFIDEIRTKHKDATHNVPAMVVGEHMEIQWGSDDGEPQGTSGAPMVHTLVSEGITNVAVVVTRYFGGIKLGTGGLVRAYTGSLKLGLEAAGVCDVREMEKLRVQVDYSTYSKVEGFAFQFPVSIEEVEYTDKVTFSLITDPENSSEALSILTNLSGGTLEFQGREMLKHKVE